MMKVNMAAEIGVGAENGAMVKKAINYLDIGGIMVTIYRRVIVY